MKTRLTIVSIFMMVAMVLASCSPATQTTPTTAAPTAPAATAASSGSSSSATGAKVDCAKDPFGCAKIPAGQTIKIGMGAPMTGDNAQFGVDISQAAKIAVQDAGDFQGFKFELVTQDDGGTGEGGAAVANKLVSDPTVVAIEGHIFSGATAAAIPIYEKAGLPMMSPSATNPDLTKSGSKVFNRVAFTDAAQGKFAAEYIYNNLGKRKIAVMHDGQTYGKGLADVVAAHFKELGGEVVDEVSITPNETDYTAPLSSIAAKKPEVLYYGGYVQEAVVLVNQMSQSGLSGVIFYGCDGTYGADFIARTGKNGEGAYAVALVPPATDAVTKFNTAYKNAYGKEAGSLSPYSWNAYDAAAVLIEAIKKVAYVGDDGSLVVPHGALVDAVRATKDYKGLSGTITCDATGECNSSGPIFYVVKDGQWAVAAK